MFHKKGKIMKKTNLNIVVVVLAAVFSSFTAMAGDKVGKLEKETQEAVANFQKADSTLKKLMDEAEGYAVFANVAKGGLVVGGAHGDGLVYEKTHLIGKAKMSQASIGAQIGGQTYAEIICFENSKALNDFKASNFEMSAEVSAVAAAEGVGKAAKYSHGVAVFAMPKKGLMAQASIGGQKFKFEPITPSDKGQETEKGKQ